MSEERGEPTSIDDSKGENEPISPEAGQPAEPTIPSTEPATVRFSPEQTALLGQKARQEIERIQKEFKRELNPDEQSIIYAKYLGAEMSVLDQDTARIYMAYQSVTKSTKLKRILAGGARVGGTTVAGIGLRALLHTVTPFSGTIVGVALGGTLGGYRGWRAKEREIFGAKGYFDEYQKIKSNPTDLEAREHAVAFLRNILQQPKVFKGDHNELLQIIAFYRQEATQLINDTFPGEAKEVETDTAAVENVFMVGEKKIEVDNQVIETFLSKLPDGATLAAGFRSNPNFRSELRKAALKGALKGAIIGAGVGLVSDLIGNYIAHLREVRASGTYISTQEGQHFNYHNEYNPVDVRPSSAEFSHGLIRSTDFGNSLSHAVREGVNNHLINLPPGTDLNSPEFQQFLHSLNFAQPHLPEYTNVPVGSFGPGGEFSGGIYHFTQSKLQSLVDNAFMSGQTPDNYYNLINYADQIMSRAPSHILAEGARQAGLQAAQQGVGEALVHGALVGGAAAAGAEIAGREKKPEEITLPGVQVAEKVEAEESGETNEPEETPAARKPSQAEATEPTAESEFSGGLIDWTDVMESQGIKPFQNKANEMIRRCSHLNAESPELKQIVLPNLYALFRFLAHNQDRYSTTIRKGEEGYQVVGYYPDVESIIVSKIGNGGERQTFRLKRKSTFKNLIITIRNIPEGG